MIYYAADVHLTNRQPTNRITDIVDAGLRKFEFLLSEAKRTHSSVILGGDLFNGACPSYDLLTAVISIIRKYPGVDIYTIYGNHDIIQTNVFGDNAAIHALTKAGCIKHLSSEPTKIDDIYFFGMDYTKEMLKEFYIPQEYADKKTALVTHLPLFPRKQVFDTIDLKDFHTNVNYVLCSHIHEQFYEICNGVHFINPGPVCRLKRTEKDVVPSYYLYHDLSWHLETIPHANAEFRAKDTCPDDIEDLENYAKIETQDIDTILKEQCKDQKVFDKCQELIKKHTKEI